ncbi:asparagine synthase [Anaeromicrobium sediminis]|uniref:Asparagine synthase n=1 Tax=Anaeromicrobium sediminis TaxID=1478221 RepID=A0A267MG55_9FIRM|nr:asparagine synthase [Anaeromicrobium sediminis]PAB58561.1 asparagine synthase [Anaeromicrobium sediminis]
MRIREGLIPTLLGTAVTATGAALAMNSKKKDDKVGWGLMGLGIAHIALGAIDLVEHK